MGARRADNRAGPEHLGLFLLKSTARLVGNTSRTADSGDGLPIPERLLLALGKLHPSAADRALAGDLLSEPAFEWDDSLALATAHRVDPMLAHNLEHDAGLAARIPADVRPTLRACRATAALRCALYQRAITPVAHALAAEDIRLVLMKGAALSSTLYPVGTRTLNDFDVLIPKRAYAKAVALFVDHGFTAAFREGRTEASELQTYHQVALVKRVGTELLTVDLHWLVYPPDRAFCRIDTASVLSRAINVGTGPMWVFAHEDIFVHYASQLVNDSLRWNYQRLADIYALANSCRCWEATIDTAVRADASGPMHLALSLAAMLGADVPAWTFQRLRRKCTGCHITSAYLTSPSFVFGNRRLPYGATPLLAALLYPRTAERLRHVMFALRTWRQRRPRSPGRMPGVQPARPQSGPGNSTPSGRAGAEARASDRDSKIL